MTQLLGTFHKDAADQMIVATARIDDCPLLTVDEKILAYPHVNKVELATRKASRRRGARLKRPLGGAFYDIKGEGYQTSW